MAHDGLAQGMLNVLLVLNLGKGNHGVAKAFHQSPVTPACPV
jgi:hypothetical protein